MEYELAFTLNGNKKIAKVAPGRYMNEAVYQITLDGRSFVMIKKEDQSWRSDADHPIDDEILRALGTAIEAHGASH